MAQDPAEVMTVVGQAIGMGHAGDRAAARVLLERAWAGIGLHGDPLHRCGIAHALADLQDDVDDELVWDLRALEAADEVTDDLVVAAGMATSARGLYSSLHLNLADAYHRLGDPDRAREHVTRGTAALDALVDDGYRRMVADGLRRVGRQVG